MEPGEKLEKPIPQSASEILAGVSAQVKQLDIDATRAMLRRDVEEHNALLLQRASLVRDLPGLLEGYRAEGGIVPDELLDVTISYSTLAQGVIKDENYFGMSAILTHPGDLSDTPNDLEKLITRFGPESE